MLLYILLLLVALKKHNPLLNGGGMKLKDFIFLKQNNANNLLQTLNITITNSEAEQIFNKIQPHSLFFDDEKFYRLLCIDEITNSNSEFLVDFTSYNLIPIIDCGDNDFICYNYKKNMWCIFNIADETSFNETTSILDYFNEVNYDWVN